MKLNFQKPPPQTDAKAEEEKEKKRLLFGTGITQKVAQKAEREAEKLAQLQAESKLQEQPQPPVVVLRDHELPDDLMGAIELDHDQQKALEGVLHQQYAVVDGPAGVGKTTLTKAMVKALESTTPTVDLNRARTERYQTNKPDFNVAVCFCAFTGRAVQQIKRALPREYHPMCDTIHATLGYRPVEEDYFDKEKDEWRVRKIFRPTFTAANKLPYKICIVDEAGMVPIYLWNELIAALPSDCRIILVGDINQLPPVQGRSVLGFAMLKWPTYTLTKIHRTAADNAIIQNAHKILNGRLPVADNKTFFMVEMPSGSIETLKKTISIIQHMHQGNKFDPFTDGLIVPQNKSMIGQVELNHSLVQYFNQIKYTDGVPTNPRTLIKAGFATVNYAVGDKVMLLNNERPLGLTNGMMGVVQQIKLNSQFRGEAITNRMHASLDGDFDLDNLADELEEIEAEEAAASDSEEERERQASHIMRVKFQNVDEEVEFSTAGAFRKLAHAYAFTCHKSQGGEYPTVVVLLHSANIKMLTREWLYTAVTRAKTRVILLHNRRGLIHAINTQRIKGNTVEAKARAFNALLDNADTSLPDLPEPREIDARPFDGVGFDEVAN
jgi:exodeoxyribonuclease V alpha subunit